MSLSTMKFNDLYVHHSFERLRPWPFKQSSIVVPTTHSNEPHPIYFDMVDGNLIRSTALKTEGSGGPSGLDAAAWKR